METSKWKAIPETQKAISVCHIQAVCDSDGLHDGFGGTMRLAMRCNISPNFPKSRRRTLSIEVLLLIYDVKSHLPDEVKKNAPRHTEGGNGKTAFL